MPTAQFRSITEDEFGAPVLLGAPNSTQRTKKTSSKALPNDDDSNDGICFSVGAAVTNSNDDGASDDDSNGNDEEQLLILGTSTAPLFNRDNDDSIAVDPNCDTANKCWSCLIAFNNIFTTHEHPLLSISVCSICHDRAEAVEGKVIDAQLDSVNDGSFTGDNGSNCATIKSEEHQEEEVNACSWCGLATESYETSSHSTSSSSPRKTIGGVSRIPLSSTVYLDDITLGDGGTNELLLCDTCPRGMCVKCVCVSLGGHVEALKAVRDICNASDGEEWQCCYCKPTEVLERLREEHELICCGEDEELEETRREKGEDVLMDVDDVDGDNQKDDGDTEQDDDDAKIARLIDELQAAEDSLSAAQQMLSKREIEQTRLEIELELVSSSPSLRLEDLTQAVEDELSDYLQKWQREFDLCSDTVVRLQEEVEVGGKVQLALFYKFREEECKRAREESGEGVRDDDSDYARKAEIELDERDELEGWNKGEFKGASGYQCPNAKIYKLEPEDLDNSNLNEIEDINTLQGQVAQMASNSKMELNSWRGKTGTTADDIEMLQKKSVKCEERDLGELIDLGKLEENCIQDDDDIAEDDRAVMVVRSKNGGKTGSRVVKQNTSLYTRKKLAAKSKRRGRLSGDTKEYQPRPPPQPRPRQDGPPKAKKRTQLLPVSSSGTLSTRSSPVLKGLLMGSELASFEDSNVTLEVAGCKSRQVSVCRPLASMLKDHQKEGVKFCWKNICHDILNPDEDLYGGVRGVVLAHNMGLGKSFQAVCLLHTLMTHPSLVLQSQCAGRGEAGRDRIVKRAMLIAPVNTLANWEQEFTKWMGPNVPAVRFFSWTDLQSKSNTIKEWYEEGGILCCSSDRYASSCKGFLQEDKAKNEDAKVTLTEEEAFFRKALFSPGPDIICLDEVHTMLKTTTSNIYKVLNGIGTKLRLALTGSPIQNNLFEYFRSASWVRPGSLGTEAAFEKTFVIPIMDGMAADCSIYQVEWQERRTKELHAILSEFVHRRDDAVLQKELPFHQTAIIQKVQLKLYQDFRKYQKRSGDLGFFKQYHALRPVSNHPACLIGVDTEKESSDPDSLSESEENEKPSVDGAELGDQPRIAPEKYAWCCDICRKARFRTFDEAVEHERNCDADGATKDADNLEWWRSFANKAKENDLDINAIENGGKIVLLLQIIAHCDLIGDKVVVFSQCLNTLTFIEGIIQSTDWGGFKPYLPNNICHQNLGGWKRNHDYVRIDGSVDAKERGDLISSFNSSGNQHTRLFLLSTKAGGLGVNLVAANRVVLFDSHWNPAVDLQAVYRCYRYGQTKPTFCYRLLGEGSMEEKIYSRAATKASLSDLVIDQKNPARSFTKKELDLLQHELFWLCCDNCSKWRMLPPGLTAEQVEEQTSKQRWFCEDNIHDSDRQCCEAIERDQSWMMKYWEKQARKEAGIDSQSQSQGGGPENELLPLSLSAIDEKLKEKTERDEVLQTLLSRTEAKRSASREGASDAVASKSTMSWISKYSFREEKAEDDDSKIEAAKAQLTAADPQKKTSSPKRVPKSVKNGKSPSDMKANDRPQIHGSSLSKTNGTSTTGIEKHLSPKRDLSTEVKQEYFTATTPSPLPAPQRLGDRKRSTPDQSPERSAEPVQPNSKKQKDDVIDLCSP